MASDVASQLYMALSLPVAERVLELTRLLDSPSPFKELAALFPQLVNSIFGGAVSPGWGLRAIAAQPYSYEFEALHRFLAPDGPLFRLCYKLLADPQLKYSFPVSMLPLDTQQMLERGRYPQYYADLISIDAQTVHLVSLTLNPFDYYIFHFATHLLDTNVTRFTWENWDTVYFNLACDYLRHFLPSDPTVPVLPHIPYYTGKASVLAPLQTSNRQLHSQSLLRIQELPGLSSQHTPTSSQTQPRNEIWRSETVVQVFIDIWLSIDDCIQTPMETHSYIARKCPLPTTSGERVRVSRMLVKQIHAFSSKYSSDPIPRSSSLRKCARQTLCTRAYHYIMYLVTMWPLDASFRLVLELWLSTIQPWRYTGDDQTILNRYPERFLMQQQQEERSSKVVDPSYTQFIAENLPTYTAVFQQIVPRFMRLDLTAPKNAIMLYRLSKVFAQPNLVSMIREIEMAAMGQNIGLHQSATMNWSMSPYGYSMSEGGGSNKWGAIAKQAIAELNTPPSSCYQPMWAEQSRELSFELMKKMANSKIAAEKNVADIENTLKQRNQGFWSFLKFWSVGGIDDDDFHLEDRRKVPSYLGIAIQQFAQIFGFEDSLLLVDERTMEDSHAEHSSFMNSTQFPHSISPQSRNKSTNIQYMGDPELTPISSFESTILVRILYQISSKINEVYRQEMSDLWRRQDFWGSVSREVLQKPRTIHTYTKGGPTYRNIVSETLGPRISLRRFGSHAFAVWLSVGYIIFRMLGYGGLVYLMFITFVWIIFIHFKATLKHFGFMKQDEVNFPIQ